jgi:hypothetical protein
MSKLLEWLDRHHVAYDVSGRGKSRPGWVNLRCPLCGRTPYCGIHLSSYACTSWCCGKINTAWALSTLAGCSYAEAAELISERGRYEPPEARQGSKLVLPAGLEDLGRHGFNYLRKRRFDPEHLYRFWHLKSLGMYAGRLAWRLFIPIYMDGEIVAYTTRRYSDKEPRYWSPPASQTKVPIEECLFGWDYVRNAVIICEGAFDAMRIGPGAVAILGSKLYPAQLRRLAQIPMRAVLLDNEPQAQSVARQMADELSVFPGVTMRVRLTSGNDPDSCSPAELSELRKTFLEN